MKFENEVYSKRLLAAVTVDEEDFEVISIQTRMEQLALTESGLGPIIPSSFTVSIRGRITAEEITKKGHVRIDLDVVSEIVKELVQSTEMEARLLKF